MDDETERDIERLIKLMDGGQILERYGDIYPGQKALALTADGPQTMSWGFQERGRLLINARCETALEKPLFKSHVRARRCLLPAAGFYEWDPAKEKVTCTAQNGGTILLAGFYRLEEDGNHFIILTTEANESMAGIHPRMPLILSEEEGSAWLADDGSIETLLRITPPLVAAHRSYEQQSLL